MRYPTTLVMVAGLVCCVLLSGCSDRDAQAMPAASSTANVREYHFAITGMHCDSCVQAITTAVGKLQGVQSCDVSLEQQTAVVSAGDTSDTQERITQAIQTLGYGVTTPTSAAAD